MIMIMVMIMIMNMIMIMIMKVVMIMSKITCGFCFAPQPHSVSAPPTQIRFKSHAGIYG